MTNFYHVGDLPANVKLNGDIAVDTEAMGLNNLRDRLCVVQISDGSGDAHIVHFPNANYEAPNLKKLLSDESRCKIFHFARFDVSIIMHYLNIKFSNVYCTKIASKLCRTYTDSHGLKDLCNTLLNIKLNKQQQTSYWGDDKLSEDQIAYAAADVLYLHELRQHLDAMLKREGRYDLALKTMSFIPTRAALDLEGWNEIDIFAH